MKNLLLLIGCQLISAACGTRQVETPHQTDRDRDGLVGPVKAVSTDIVTASGTLVQPLSRAVYDDAGNYREREVFDDYGGPVGRETFVYANQRLVNAKLVDSKGTVLEHREYSNGSSARFETIKVTSQFRGTYEEHHQRGPGNRVEAIRYVSDRKDIGSTVFRYGSQPQSPDEIAFFLDGRPATAPIGPCFGAHRVVYQYVDGRVAEQTTFEEDGSVKRRSAFKYDVRGNVSEEARTEGMGDSLLRFEYRYDDRGNWIRREDTMRFDVGRTPQPASPGVRITTRTITYFDR